MDPLKKIQNASLYGILDSGYTAPQNWPSMAENLIQGGVFILQIRAKDLSENEILKFAQPVLPITRKAGVPLIINDYPAIARELGAEGCHVGQDDLSVAEARKQAGKNAIIGKSTHSLEQAIKAEAERADYIGVGPIFSTPTKPGRPAVGMELIQQVASRVKIPQFCIGGIKLSNLGSVVSAGAKRVVIVSELLTSDDPAGAARHAREILTI